MSAKERAGGAFIRPRFAPLGRALDQCAGKCVTGKDCYKTERAARLVAKMAPDKARVYCCEQCHYFHMTTVR